MRWAEFDDPDKEKARLEIIVAANPADANAYYKLAAVHTSLLDFTKAIEFCEKAITLDPKNVTYRALSSYAHTEIEDHNQAIEDLVTIIELGADESDYYVDMAQGEQRGMDKEYALLTSVGLREEGRGKIADKLEEWLVRPLR